MHKLQRISVCKLQIFRRSLVTGLNLDIPTEFDKRPPIQQKKIKTRFGGEKESTSKPTEIIQLMNFALTSTSIRTDLLEACSTFRATTTSETNKIDSAFMTMLVNTYVQLQGSLKACAWFLKIPNTHLYLAWDEPSVNRLLFSLARDGHFDQSAILIGSVTERGLKVGEKTINYILSEISKSRAQDIDKFFGQLEASGQVIHLTTLNWMVHNTLVPYARKAGSYKSGQGDGMLQNLKSLEEVRIEAEKYIKIMEKSGYSPDSWTRNSFLTFYANNNQVDKAKSLLHEMETNGPEPNIKSYGILLNCYFKSKKFLSARELIKKVLSKGLKFDKIMYSICIDGFKKAGRFEEVQAYYTEMVKNGFKPSFYDYVSTIDMNCRVGNVSKATEVFHEFLSIGHQPNEIILSLFIKGHAVNKDIDGALNVFREMKKYGINNTVISYNNMIGYLVKQGHYREALDLRQEMTNLGIQPDRYTSYSIIHAYSMIGNETEMLLAFESHIDHGYPISSYALNSLVSYYARNKETKKALKVADYLSDITSKRPWLNPVPQYTIAHFIQPLKQHQKTEEVLKFLGKQPKQDWNFVVLDIFIRALEDVGDCEGIIQAFWQSLQGGLVPDLRLYTSYIKIMRRHGIKEECEKAYKHLIDNGFEPNEKIEKAMGRAAK